MAVTRISSPVEPDTMTLAELAANLNIGMTRAYKMARANTLPIPVLKIGREYRFSRRALERLLESGRTDEAA